MTNENKIIVCDNWGFYIDIENAPPKYIDNYTLMREKYKIKNKNKFYTDFETIYEDLEYYNEVKYPQTLIYYNYNKHNNVNSPNKIFCLIYCAVAASLLLVFIFQ
jgi:hypothetical protein